MVRRPWMDVTIKAALIGAAVLVYLDLKAEIRSVRVDLGTRIDRLETRMGTRIGRLETRMDRLETKVDGLETKIDEVRGHFRFEMTEPNENPPPTDVNQ